MNLHQIPRAVRTFLNAPLSIFRPYNICLWHAGRCGSTVLGDLFMQDGRIVWGGEILESYSKQIEAGNLQSAPWSEVKRRIRKNQRAAGSKIFGFEMKVWHLIRMGFEPAKMLEFLKEQRYEKHIILERKNYLRIIVSSAVAIATSKFHCRLEENPIPQRIHISLEEVRFLLQIYDQYYKELKKLLSDEFLLITYEDDILPDPVIAYKKIVSSLELTPKNVTVRYQRTNPKALEKIVINIDEIRQHLKGTRYEWMPTGD
jgi:hypothetical protein